MNLEKDFVCDYALQLFVKTKTCPVGPFRTCKYRDVLVRQVLHTVMCSVIKAQTADVKFIRMIFEDLPSLIKSLDGFVNTTDSKILLDNYYEEVVELFQLVALDQRHNDSVITKALQNLKSSTAALISQFREQLKPPFVVTVFKEYEKKLNERLDETSVVEGHVTDDDEETTSVDVTDVETEDRNSSSSNSQPSSLVLETATESTNTADDVDINNSEEPATGENDESFQQVDASFPATEKETVSKDTKGVPSLSAAGKSTELSTLNLTNSDSETQDVGSKGSTSDHDKNKATTNPSFSKSRIRNNEPNNIESSDALEVEVIITTARKRRPFCVESDAMLIHGVKKYGLSEWKKIHDNYDFPPYRKPMHLKDRWRTLRDNKLISVDEGRISVIAEKQANAFKDYLEKHSLSAEHSIDTSRFERTKNSSTTDHPEKEVPEPPVTRPWTTSSPMTRSKSKNTLPSFHQLISHQTSPEPSPISDDPDSEKTKSFVGESGDVQIEDESVLPSTFFETNESRSNKKETAAIPLSFNTQPQRKRRKRRLWEADGEVLTWDNSSTLQHPSSAKKTTFIKKKTTDRMHKKKPWHDWEVSSLVKGLRRYGVGQWSMILDQYRFSNRDSVMLKDKYRNMLKNKELPRDLTLRAGLKASLELSRK